MGCGHSERLFPSFPDTLLVRCPIGVVSFKLGEHSCDPAGRPSLSAFRALGYDAASDTSLVWCRPFTGTAPLPYLDSGPLHLIMRPLHSSPAAVGRTHQLRLHLQLLGSPIANDPCYGGELFFDDAARRSLAVDAVSLPSLFCSVHTCSLPVPYHPPPSVCYATYHR